MNNKKFPSIWFIEHIWFEFEQRLKKEDTKKNYFSAIRTICEYLNCDFTEITLTDAKAYFDLISYGKQSLSKRTIQTKLAMLRSVGTFIYQNKKRFGCPDYVNVYTKIKSPDYDNYLHIEEIPTLEELDFILEEAKDNPMLFLMILLVLRCSLTSDEICRLTPNDICIDGRNIMFLVLEQNGKRRYVKIPDDVKKYLLSYLEQFGCNPFLFQNQRGGQLKVRTLQNMVRELIDKAGINRKFNLQDIRNASITYMLHGGAPVEQVAEHAGISERWMYRYNKIIEELDFSPVDYMNLTIK
ncbi:tyrosine-type recombinase/integrase [Velocimicrobium porci]|uniref:Tyrosine-type recombinase/integrase n=1 Tax=Velocimicrobium porci TaxID=2606634 RepID=A0A6L5Y1K6_9FIRM|nr:tyrosine-type recombinase/integrase [Velocimicrobium porci]MSS64003.1 tyrosine-type recombinase/integrase [Velocimicrobium porci]